LSAEAAGSRFRSHARACKGLDIPPPNLTKRHAADLARDYVDARTASTTTDEEIVMKPQIPWDVPVS